MSVSRSIVAFTVLAGLVAPVAPAWAQCVTVLEGFWHYRDLPPGGQCVDTTYDVAELHCSEVWSGVHTAVRVTDSGKAVSYAWYDFECVDGQVAWFELSSPW